MTESFIDNFCRYFSDKKSTDIFLFDCVCKLSSNSKEVSVLLLIRELLCLLSFSEQLIHKILNKSLKIIIEICNLTYTKKM